MTGRRVVVGVGNVHRHDDGVGPIVVAEVARLDLAGVVLVVSDGEPTRLLDAWAGAELAVIIDAVRCEPVRPGRIHRSLRGDLPPAPAGGTHGLGIIDAVRLSAALDSGPRRLVVLGVEVADTGPGTGLSRAVSEAVPEVVRAVLAELTGHPSPIA